MRQFTLTTEHIKLLRRMCVGWQDCETGAPEIDPKRPYGNSDVAYDVAEILGLEIGEDGLPEQTQEYCNRLHHETKDALQIVLATGKFQPGTYIRATYSTEWYGKP